jgi:Arc/MetJ family transcription regulator
MRTNIDIDERLLRQVMRLTGTKTKRAAVHEALRRTANTERMRKAFKKLRGAGWEGNLDEMRRIREF